MGDEGLGNFVNLRLVGLITRAERPSSHRDRRRRTTVNYRSMLIRPTESYDTIDFGASDRKH